MKRYTATGLLGPLNDVETKNAPAELFVKGDVSILRGGPRVSIVGSRKVSKAGSQRAYAFARMLAAENVVVVSGLAEGVDKSAHDGCIQANGRTIAIIGTPIDKCYPAKHQALQNLIAEEHLLISQFPIGSRTYPSCFPQRNRTMALIADATLIVEAADESGSLHQGWESLRLGRPLFISEEILGDKSLKWPTELMKYGASPISCDKLGVEELLQFVPLRCDAVSL